MHHTHFVKGPPTRHRVKTDTTERGFLTRKPLLTYFESDPVTDRGEGRSFRLDVAIPGAIAGMLGGLLMAFVYMTLSAAVGEGFWSAPKAMSSLIFHNTAYLPDLGGGAIIIGMIIHFAVSGALGTLFALLLPRHGMTMFATFPLALLYAMTMFVVMNWFVAYWAAPLVNREILHPLFFVSHLVFGACLAIVQPMREGRRLAHVRPDQLLLEREPVRQQPTTVVQTEVIETTTVVVVDRDAHV